jgi:hypothetical protein
MSMVQVSFYIQRISRKEHGALMKQMLHASGIGFYVQNMGNISNITWQYKAISSDNKIKNQESMKYEHAWPFKDIQNYYCLEEIKQIL